MIIKQKQQSHSSKHFNEKTSNLVSSVNLEICFTACSKAHDNFKTISIQTQIAFIHHSKSLQFTPNYANHM